VANSRILVAVSTPWASDKLFVTIRDLAERLQSVVIVAHVARPTEEDETEDDTRSRSEQTLATLTNRLAEAGASAEALLLYGDDIAKAILNAAEDQRATMILLGFTGKGRLARLLEGDVPQQILRSADIPVLMLPPDWAGTL